MKTQELLIPFKRDRTRALRAQFRDTVVLIQESGSALLLFFVLVIGGSLLFYFFYTDPQTGQTISYGEALYGTFALLFFQDALDFPNEWFLQILYFIIPILGLVVVADGIIRFGVALTNKKERGQKWQVAMASTFNDHIIVCGLGKVGYRVTLELLKLDREIVAIETNPECRFIEKIKALGVPVLIADARRSENLFKAGIEKAAAVIPCTDDELANLDIALDAREINPKAKIVLRMFDADLARRVEKGFGIHTAFSTSALAAPVFATASMRVNVKSSFYWDNTLLHISEHTISPKSALDGWPIEQLYNQLDLSVVGLTKEEQSILHPTPDLVLEVGNKLMVMANLETIRKLEDLIKP